MKALEKYEVAVKDLNVKNTAERLKNGSEDALEEIIEGFTPLVSTIIYNLTGGELGTADIEELASDTFVTLWYNREKVQPDKLKGYICCIAKNKAKDRLRTSARHKTVSIEEMDFEDDLQVSAEIENKIITDALRAALDEIGEPDREIIIRHYYYYQSSAEISEKMDIKSETVKSKIKRTREKLKKLLIKRGFTR